MGTCVDDEVEAKLPMIILNIFLNDFLCTQREIRIYMESSIPHLEQAEGVQFVQFGQTNLMGSIHQLNVFKIKLFAYLRHSFTILLSKPVHCQLTLSNVPVVLLLYPTSQPSKSLERRMYGGMVFSASMVQHYRSGDNVVLCHDCE